MEAAKTCRGDSILQAWKEAGEVLIAPGTPPYVLVVTSGIGWQPSAHELHELDLAAKSVGAERPSTVAEMLLPGAAKQSTGNADDAIEAGLRMLGRARRKRLRFSQWSHTYFERLVGAYCDRTGNKNQIGQNRLLGTIEKLNTWGRNFESVFYIHTNMPNDSFRTMGSPCLQYLQFRAHGNNKLSIVGLYRAHDYTNKFLGNALGIQDVGEFVARHTGREYDGQTIISLHPFCGSKSQLRKFIDAATA
jgi:hypothetical protein